MAYVLVAVGALMAAAGLYVIGYSVLNTRFEDYWASMTAGSTLAAGGIVTLAIGFATRALRDLRAALSVQPSAVPASPPAATDVPASLPTVKPARPSRRPPAPPTPESAQRTLLPPLPPQLETDPSPKIEAQLPTHTAEPPGWPATAGEPASVAAAYEPPVAPYDAEPHDLIAPAEPHHPARAGQSEDDIAEAPPAGEDTNPAEPPKPPAPPPRAPEPHQMPDDWLDRAFADLDQELPIGGMASRSPPATPYRPDVPLRTEPHPLRPAPSPEPADAPVPEQATAPTIDAAPSPEEPAPGPPPAPEPPPSAVIGRYEADGTSYVMYADGSIEAQSSAGVYRFSSMAELKSFIES